jgi:hypothetical protein
MLRGMRPRIIPQASTARTFSIAIGEKPGGDAAGRRRSARCDHTPCRRLSLKVFKHKPPWGRQTAIPLRTQSPYFTVG